MKAPSFEGAPVGGSFRKGVGDSLRRFRLGGDAGL